jgi:hypothetical protein
MSWVRLEDTFPEHPKIDKVGGDAAWLHVCALAYCNRNETDGLVPAGSVTRLSDRKNPRSLAARLVDAGLWEDDPNGWRIHDYLHYQPSRAQRDKSRSDARERMKKARSSGDVRANTSRSSPNPDPTRPDPRVQVREDSTPENTQGAVDIPLPRRDQVLDLYASYEIAKAKGMGTVIHSELGYRKKARQTGSEHPELDAWLATYPTAPPSAVAAWLMGDKHSMSYYVEPEDEMAEVIQLREGA